MYTKITVKAKNETTGTTTTSEFIVWGELGEVTLSTKTYPEEGDD